MKKLDKNSYVKKNYTYTNYIYLWIIIIIDYIKVYYTNN